MSQEAKNEEQVKHTPGALSVQAIEGAQKAADAGEARELLKLGAKFGALEMAAKFVEDGRSVAEFKDALLLKNSNFDNKINVRPAAEQGSTLGITPTDARDFRWTKLLYAISENDPRGVEREMEMSHEARKKYFPTASANSICIPGEVLRYEARDYYGTNQDILGSKAVGVQMLGASFIDILRSKLVIAQAGATILSDLSSNIAIPKAYGPELRGEWVEEGKEPKGAYVPITQVTLTAKRLATFRDYSRKLLVQASIDIENFVKNDIAQSIAGAIDYTILNPSDAAQALSIAERLIWVILTTRPSWHG